MSKQTDALKATADRAAKDLAAARAAHQVARDREASAKGDLARAKEAYTEAGTDEAWDTVDKASRAFERAQADVARTLAIAEAKAAVATETHQQAANAALAELVQEIEPIITLEEGDELVRAALTKLRSLNAVFERNVRNNARRQAIFAHCAANGIPAPDRSVVGTDWHTGDLFRHLFHRLYPNIEQATFAAALENNVATEMHALTLAEARGVSAVDYAFARSRLPKEFAARRAAAAGSVTRVPRVEIPTEGIFAKMRAKLAAAVTSDDQEGATP